MERNIEFHGEGAVYIRVSTDDQDTERQYESANRFLKRRGRSRILGAQH